MFDELVSNLVKIKQKFSKTYSGNAHIQEIIPSHISKEFPIDENHLKQLHIFAEKNPIYHNYILLFLNSIYLKITFWLLCR